MNLFPWHVVLQIIAFPVDLKENITDLVSEVQQVSVNVSDRSQLDGVLWRLGMHGVYTGMSRNPLYTYGYSALRFIKFRGTSNQTVGERERKSKECYFLQNYNSGAV